MTIPACNCWSCGQHFEEMPDTAAALLTLVPGESIMVCYCSAVLMWNGGNFVEPTDEDRERLYEKYKYLPEAQEDMRAAIAAGCGPAPERRGQERAFYNDNTHGGPLDNSSLKRLIREMTTGAPEELEVIERAILSAMESLGGIYAAVDVMSAARPGLAVVAEIIDDAGHTLQNELRALRAEKKRAA